MAPRPNWKGYLKLSLVSCPVALFPATTTSERVSFRTLNRATGNRLRRQMVDEQTGEAVESEDQIKGYEVAKGEFIQVEDDEIKSVQVESNHTIDIEQFVRRTEVDELYLDTPYYLTPTDRVGEEAFAVIRDAMRTEKMVGLARVVLFRRERIVMLEPRAKGITVTSLHYANEVHQAASYFDEIPDLELPKQMLELASHIIFEDDGQVRAERVRGPLRERADRADPLQAAGHAGEGAAGAAPDQRDQPHGCAPPQRGGRRRPERCQGRRRRACTGQEGREAGAGQEGREDGEAAAKARATPAKGKTRKAG